MRAANDTCLLYVPTGKPVGAGDVTTSGVGLAEGGASDTTDGDGAEGAASSSLLLLPLHDVASTVARSARHSTRLFTVASVPLAGPPWEGLVRRPGRHPFRLCRGRRRRSRGAGR